MHQFFKKLKQHFYSSLFSTSSPFSIWFWRNTGVLALGPPRPCSRRGRSVSRKGRETQKWLSLPERPSGSPTSLASATLPGLHKTGDPLHLQSAWLTPPGSKRPGRFYGRNLQGLSGPDQAGQVRASRLSSLEAQMLPIKLNYETLRKVIK